MHLLKIILFKILQCKIFGNIKRQVERTKSIFTIDQSLAEFVLTKFFQSGHSVKWTPLLIPEELLLSNIFKVRPSIKHTLHCLVLYQHFVQKWMDIVAP